MVATSAFSRLSSLALAILKKPPALPGKVTRADQLSALILLTALTRLLLSALLSRLLTTLAGLLTRFCCPPPPCWPPCRRHLGFAGRGAVRSHSSLSLLTSPPDATTTSPNGPKFR